MSVSPRYLLDQRDCVQALGRLAFKALLQRAGVGGKPAELPGPVIKRVLPPRSAALIRAYIRNVGGRTASYRGVLPPHFFPQWAFALAAEALEGVSYPLLRVLNAGCRYQVNQPLPADAKLHVQARLKAIEDNGKRAMIRVEVTTGTADVPDALVAEMTSYVPLGSGGGSRAGGRPRVPDDAREIASWRLGPRAGRDFALLTGDINPLHWLPAYARAAGFRNTILHGFATMSRAVEGLNAALWSGRVDAMRAVEVRFTRPLVLPRRVGLFLAEDDAFYVGDAPSGPAYLAGRFDR